jgi:hypothetical protein
MIRYAHPRAHTALQYSFNPTQFTSRNENISSLFSPPNSTDSTNNCLSTASGTTNFIKPTILSDHPDPYRLDTPFVLQLADSTLHPIQPVPFLQHPTDLDSQTNPHAVLL